MNDKVKIIPLGGLDELYKNLTIVEINDDIFVIEAGMRFPDKDKPGIDFIVPNFDYLKANKHKIRCYILTHAFDSVYGALPFIYESCPAPIICSDITKISLTNFCRHNNQKKDFEFRIVKPTDDIVVAGRKISFFSTCSNMANSSGVAIWTDGGYIVYTGSFVIDSNYDSGFITDSAKIAELNKEGVLALMSEATFSEIPGYANPKYKIVPMISRTFKDAPGRIFIGIDGPNLYNFAQIIKLAKKENRKIVAYDSTTRELLMMLGASGQVIMQKGDVASMEDVNRLRAKDLMIVIAGFGNSLYSKISLLALHLNDDQLLKLNETDTFIIAYHNEIDRENIATETLDNLYRSGCNVVSFSKKEYIKMHACEEDIKTMINFTRPKFFIPVNGFFKQLLASAKLALEMGIGLTHQNVFILDNGNVLKIEDGKASFLPEKVPSGDLFIDGKGIGDVAGSVIEERSKFSDGVIVLAVTISKSKRQIVGGPDIQARGFVYVKESEGLMREIQQIFVSNISQALSKPSFSSKEIEINVKEQIFRAVRRSTLKTPMIMPIIVEID